MSRDGAFDCEEDRQEVIDKIEDELYGVPEEWNLKNQQIARKLKWRTEPLPDDELIVLFQVDVFDKRRKETFIEDYVGYSYGGDAMMMTLGGEEVGWEADQVSRWVPYSEVLQLIEE